METKRQVVGEKERAKVVILTWCAGQIPNSFQLSSGLFINFRHPELSDCVIALGSTGKRDERLRKATKSRPGSFRTALDGMDFITNLKADNTPYQKHRHFEYGIRNRYESTHDWREF